MNLSGKIVLVTGSTDGVGREVTLRLGAMGVKVLLHGRDRTRGEALAARLGPDAMFYPADFAALAGVRGLATTIQRDHSRLDVLISNAGIGTASGGRQRAEGADGHELRFAVNHLAGFLLTRLLLPLLKASAPARIVRVSSAGQYPFDFDDVMLRQNYDGARAYMQSNLAQ